jgi:hypothetical protein
MAKKGFTYVRQHHVGLLALFIALSGTAYATTLPRNSVGTAQLKKNAVTSAKVKNHSLMRADFATGQLLRGPQGLRGLQGIPGPQGTPGRNGATNVFLRTSTPKDIAPGGTGGVGVLCPNNESVVGGGAASQFGVATLYASAPLAPPGDNRPIQWTASFRNDDPTLTDTVFAFAICVSP